MISTEKRRRAASSLHLFPDLPRISGDKLFIVHLAAQKLASLLKIYTGKIFFLEYWKFPLFD